MLTLKQIIKDYSAGGATVRALKGIDIKFRKSEFVAILGPSGCGKTTLLNIIGGLDQYTSGDLIIRGKSTKQFKDRDWDTYRNHSIGFVFQSYNLIPHQTVLSNVELALTLSGVSKGERRKRAVDALTRVGLGDQLHKKPNQMSGGQMQRVAIARALVNDPDILLADEPTGALDSETSVQIMEILREISADKLIIMVTHNPELAEQYANRTVRLLDGAVISDSNPYDPAENMAEEAPKPAQKEKKKKTSMSFFTALSLSLNNLLTKKGRTVMTSFAGSIGIIGIALILSMSSGARAYISRVEEDTISSYPITIEESTVDMTSLMISLMGNQTGGEEHDLDKIYSSDIMTDMISTAMSEVRTNNLEAFKRFIEAEGPGAELRSLTNDIKYRYSTRLNVYKADTTGGVYQVNPSRVMGLLSFGGSSGSSGSFGRSGVSVFTELMDNVDLLSTQYERVGDKGHLPERYDEVILIVDENNEITDYTLYTLGLKDADEISQMVKDMLAGKVPEKATQSSYSFDEILDLRFKLLVNTDYFEKQDGVWVDKSDDDLYLAGKLTDALEIKVVGIYRPAPNSNLGTVSGMIGYRADLMTYLIDQVNASEIVKEQKASPDTDIFTGLPFEADDTPLFTTMEELYGFISMLPEDQQQYVGMMLSQMRESGMSDEQIVAVFAENMRQETDATYDGNLALMGVSDLEKPSGISIYPKDFDAKERISEIISEYNASVTEENSITYTDYIALMLSSVTTIIDAISYILIGFVAISLVVSSIMIGIITYISVLERTKEIGILRSIGASKKDISRVFNAETLIVGFVSGAIGILVTMLLNIPINMIIKSFADISGIAALPWAGALILVAISMLLTLIAGLIPSRVAAKKDPVVALRTE